MKFSVCIKQVPDISAPFQIRDGNLVPESERMIMNAYDASAVEASLVLGGEVEVILIGPEKARETIRKALAMGADRGVHILLDDEVVLDSAAHAEILSAYFKQAGYEVIMCGKQAQDTDAGLTGGMLAAKLSLPYASNAVGLELDGGEVVVTRQGDVAREIIALPVPCLVTCSNDMNEPRNPGLKGIMESKRKPVETIHPDALGLDRDRLREAMKTRVLGYEPVPEREPGKKLEGEPEDIARRLVDMLRNEARVI